MNLTFEDKELDDSIRQIDSVLTQVLKAQARPETVATVEELQTRFAETPSEDSLSKRTHLHETVADLDAEAIGEVVRAFNLYFSLVNIAEESHYLGIRRQQAEEGGHYWSGSFHDTLLTLKESGVGADKLQVLLNELLYLPVITAHPSEVKRRTVKSALRNVFLSLKVLGNDQIKGYFHEEALKRLQCQIQMLWKTDEVRARKLAVADEIDAGLFFFPLSLFEATARVYRNFERSISDVYGEEVALQIRVPSFLNFGSWIGGDRDGNPNVTSETTVLALRMQAQTILQEYIRRLDELRGQLSHSEGFCELSEEFINSLEVDRTLLGATVAELEKPYLQEPYRHKLALMKYRMECSLLQVQQHQVRQLLT